MEQRGYFIGTQYGPMAHADWPDKEVASTVQVAFYDATNPEAREFVWSQGQARTTWSRTASRPSGWTPASRS